MGVVSARSYPNRLRGPGGGGVRFGFGEFITIIPQTLMTSFESIACCTAFSSRFERCVRGISSFSFRGGNPGKGAGDIHRPTRCPRPKRIAIMILPIHVIAPVQDFRGTIPRHP